MQCSLYIHFPFCLKKCLYCDFNSLADSPVSPDEYVDGVQKEMVSRAGQFPGPVTAPTLYFGGGTPSLMAPELAARLIETAQRLYGLAGDAEITLEANPGTLTAAKLAGYRSAGVNRLSIGVQSFNDAYLMMLGRIHTGFEAEEAFAMARTAGFANIGVDLIHSLPGETVESWLDDLARAVSLGPEHISAYGLTIEAGTPFHDLERGGRLSPSDEDEGARMFRQTGEFLRERGFEQYEISNFALPGYRSRHNQVYWQRGGYLGFGAGAHSYLPRPGHGRRWRNRLSPQAYLEAVSRSKPVEEEVTILTERDAMAEFLFLGLRMLDGVKPEYFVKEFGMTLDDAYPGVLPALIAEGLLHRRGEWLGLTGTGLIFSNQVFLRFI
jgi:oxygen-independent coproporphyrinogen-3 oxidase